MNKLKLNIGKYILKVKTKELDRKKTVIGLSYAKSVGIIFNATSNKSFDLVKDLVKILTEKGIKCNTIGYINSKKIGEHYLYRKGFAFITNKQLNWYYKPTDEQADEFINTEFDILINLSISDDFPVQYLTALSKAKFKVGKPGVFTPYLDMMIDVKEVDKNKQKEENEIKQRLDNKEITTDEFRRLINSRSIDELKLDFLIEQTIHYLSIVNKNFVNLAVSN